ncbi:retinol dehydrogenase 11-like isoform X1 [Hyalella azteca]|uniref:Retinol dehydrogenase 11-like isoform X1 n=1 Tax=Hyalella azteca TaxID=294128 RepID=A0A979FML7_HYAAZ|nr:retinol dehydrogenase 11-like isoform X1 [Hyalella azteca]
MLAAWCLLYLVVLLLAVKYAYRAYAGRCYSTNRLDGKLAIVTGASAGIGAETCLDFARRGARVIMACRNLEKAQRVAANIKRMSGNEAVTVKKLDLASLASVRAFCNDILKTETALHILVNNAGIGGSVQKQMSEDGFELTMASNHYGHFLLTNMLGKLLKNGAPSRVVCVASLAYFWTGKMDVEDLNFRNIPYGDYRAYSLSKLANILMTRELARRLEGTGVTTYSVHPGFVATEIFHKNSVMVADWFANFMCFMGKSAELGAQTNIYCAVDDAVAHQSGRYYSDCRELRTYRLANDDSLAAKLWATSERDVKLAPHEANI